MNPADGAHGIAKVASEHLGCYRYIWSDSLFLLKNPQLMYQEELNALPVEKPPSLPYNFHLVI